MNGSDSRSASGSPDSDPSRALETVLADQLAQQVLGMELHRMVRYLPAADILQAARELGFIHPEYETHEDRQAVVASGRAALDRAVDRITARAMCLRDATECCVYKDGESCAA